MPDDPGATSKPYDEVTDVDYGAQVATSFTTAPIRGGLLLSGPCPRCSDPMTFPHVDVVFKSIWPGGGTPSYDTSKLPMICTCQEEHPGRPTGAEGCGAYWNITVTTS